jgi:two-component system, sensor histidine kinase YesM
MEERGKPRRAAASIRRRLIANTAILVLALVASNLSFLLGSRKATRIEEALARTQGMAQTIFTLLGDTRESLEKCLQSPDPLLLDRYNKTYPELADLSIRFAAVPRSEGASRVATDFRYMIQTFLEEANGAVASKKDGDLASMNRRYAEVLNIYRLLGRQAERLFGVLGEDQKAARAQIDRAKTASAILGLAMALVAIVASVLFITGVSRLVLRPIQGLIGAARRMATGDYSQNPPDPGAGAELVTLTEAFNGMSGVINGQIEALHRAAKLEQELHEEELANQRMSVLVKEAELRSLQARINPHFFFNTLNMICQMAYVEEAGKTATLLESLSALFRYSLDNFGRNVRMRDELQSIRDYIYVQDLRFGGRIGFKVEADPAADEALLPCMVLQPLVENAVVHGVKTYIRDGRVELTVGLKGDRVHVRVADNGIGMSAERLSEVRGCLAGAPLPGPARMGEDTAGIDEGGGIALFNLHARLALLFDSRLDFSISSSRGAGTTVDFSFPLRQGEAP